MEGKVYLVALVAIENATGELGRSILDGDGAGLAAVICSEITAGEIEGRTEAVNGTLRCACGAQLQGSDCRVFTPVAAHLRLQKTDSTCCMSTVELAVNTFRLQSPPAGSCW